MTKENYLKLRNDLKVLAAQIRPAKIEFNKSQHDYSLLQNKNGDWYSLCKNIVNPKMDKGYFSNLKVIYVQAMLRIEEARVNKKDLKKRYRHLHIVYSLARGKTLEQIEPKVRGQGTYWANIPDNSILESIKNEYGFDEVKE